VILRSMNDGGEIMRAVMGLLSREEQRERVRRPRMGMRSKARQGRVVGNAPGPRYGFRRSGDWRSLCDSRCHERRFSAK
jgi:DNA invertase Pin-like site-specific DNA recombinase